MPAYRTAYSHLNVAALKLLEAVNAIAGNDSKSIEQRRVLMDCYWRIDKERIEIVNANLARRNHRYIALTKEFRGAAAGLDQALGIVDGLNVADRIIGHIRSGIEGAINLLENEG